MKMLSSKNKIIAFSVIGVTLILVLMMGYQIGRTIGVFGQGGGGFSDPSKKPGAFDQPDYLFEDNKVEILLLGVDARAGETASRSDTTMVAFLDLNEATVKLLSIPRDTRVQIPGHRKEKFNHSHSYGGPELTMETANDFLGTNIKNYIEVDFDGFKEVVDAVGGVEMDVPVRMYLPLEGIDLKPGVQMLNGSKALQFVRYRSDGGDLVRIDRQQQLIKTLAKKMLETRNLWTATKLVNAGFKMTKTDFTMGELTYIASAMMDLNVDEMQTATVPGDSKTIDGIWYIIADEQLTLDLVKDFKGLSEPVIEAETDDVKDE